ncbi:MAG: oligosaccharide flippase family protein [Bacteroidales bacterium]|nr:oligosaccharide flippase family protein [Bacteroidales bacterium]
MLLMSGHKAFYKNTAWQYGLQLIKYILPLVTLPYLTRVLEPEGYAVYAYVLSFMGFAQVIVDFGFNLSGTKQIANATDNEEASRIFGSITQARLILCVIVAAGVAAIGSFIPIVRENAAYAALAYIAVCGRAMAPDFIFQGKEQLGTLTTRYFAAKGTSTVLTFVFVHSSADLLWLPLLDILASVIAFIWSVAAAKQRFGIRVVWVKFSSCWKELMRSGYYCLSNLASSSFSGLTTLVIGIAITDSVQIAYWSLAMTAVAAVQALYTPITNSLYPHMVVGGDYDFARKLALISLPFVTAGTVLFFIVADWIVMLLGGAQYMDGVYVVQLLAPVLWFSFYGMYFGWPVMGAIGKVKQLTATTIIAGLTGAIGLLALCAFGIASVAAFCIVRNAAEIVMCVLRVMGAHKALVEAKTNSSGI